MKTHLVKTYYEVRTKGDGEFDWFSVPPQASEFGEVRYDHNSLESATKYAAEINGFVVEVTEKTLGTVTL
jgi:hypothetical protein